MPMRPPMPGRPQTAAPTRAAAPVARAAQPATVVGEPTPRRRGAPTRAEKEALAAQRALANAEAPMDEVVEGQEGEEAPEAVVEHDVSEMAAEQAASEALEEQAQAPAPVRRQAPPRAAQPAPKAATKAVATRQAPRPPMVAQPQVQQSTALKGDITIPRILLMQGSSQLVKDRKAQVGDIVRSSNGERLGGSNGPDQPADEVEIIPLALSQSWTIMSEDGKQFIRTEPRTPANDSAPWEFEDTDGQIRKRLKTIDAIVMIASDIDRLQSEGGVAVDEDGVPLDLDSSLVLPHAISFKSTGFQAGKGISTFFARVEALMKTHPLTRPYHFSLPLSCFPQEDDGNEWHVFDIGSARRSNDNGTKGYRVQEAAHWYETINSRNVILEDEGAAEQRANDAIPTTNAKGGAPTRNSQF